MNPTSHQATPRVLNQATNQLPLNLNQEAMLNDLSPPHYCLPSIHPSYPNPSHQSTTPLKCIPSTQAKYLSPSYLCVSCHYCYQHCPLGGQMTPFPNKEDQPLHAQHRKIVGKKK